MAAREIDFDVVSEVNMEEVKNAIQTALKELKNRSDSKESIANVKSESDKLVAVAKDDYRVGQAKDILFRKLVECSIPIKNIHFSESEKALGGTARQHGDLTSGTGRRNAKKINTAIKNSGIKVKLQIREDKARVTGKNRDDLQKVVVLL